VSTSNSAEVSPHHVHPRLKSSLHSLFPIHRHRLGQDLRSRINGRGVPSAILPRMATMSPCNGRHARALPLNRGWVLVLQLHGYRHNPVRMMSHSPSEGIHPRQKNNSVYSLDLGEQQSQRCDRLDSSQHCSHHFLPALGID
jgi:hypothetical protein